MKLFKSLSFKVALVLLACVLVTGVAFAQKGPGNSSGVGPSRDDCMTTGYEAYLDGPGGPPAA